MNPAGHSEPQRIGIIGAGLIADTHVEAIKASVPDAVIFVVDPLPGKAELLRRKYDLAGSSVDLSEMLAEGLFSVHILSPPHLHVCHARQCLEAGCHVLVEKPLCFDVTEARELYELARARGLSLCVDHSLLFQPSVLRMRKIFAEQPRQRILQLDSFYGLDAEEGLGAVLPAAHWKRSMPGGSLMDSLVHPVSLAIGLTGTPHDLVVANSSEPGAEQLKVMWRAGGTLVTVAISQGAQPFRRTTTVVTSEMTCVVDHSTEVLSVLGQGFGPRSLKKLMTNLTYSARLVLGTTQTVWNVFRKKLLQNPGARALIHAYYRHLAGEGEMPIPGSAVLDTTLALQEIGSALGPLTPPAIVNSAQETGSDRTPATPPRGVLVTGASGFLGRHLCDALLARGGFRVLAQVRRGANADKLPSASLLEKRYLDFDYLNAEELGALLKDVETVVHCAHAAGAKTWRDYERRNVGHSLALYEAAAAAGCPRFVHVSSLAVYGVQPRGPMPLDETAPLSNGTSGWDFYIRSKARAEEVLQERAARGGPELLVLRLGLLYSPEGQRLFSKSIPTQNGRLFICIGSGRNHLPYTRVDSIAAQIVSILEQEPFPTGVFNLAGDQKENLKDFLVSRSERLGVKAKFLHLPAFPLRIAARGLELVHQVGRRHTAPKVTTYIIDSVTRDLIYDTSKAERELGWNPAEATS